MENLLLVYVIILGLLFWVLLFALSQRDSASERRLARVRVRIDENQRQPQFEREHEGAEQLPGPLLLAVGSILFFFLLLSSLM